MVPALQYHGTYIGGHFGDRMRSAFASRRFFDTKPCRALRLNVRGGCGNPVVGADIADLRGARGYGNQFGTTCVMVGRPMEVYLAQPRGFCAGVVRAIEIVERALEKYGPPVYVRHDIVHNKYVVESP